MRSTFRYTCHVCNEVHEGFPAIAYNDPDPYLALSPEDRISLCRKTSDVCVIDDREFYIRCQALVPIAGHEEMFAWGVWGSLGEESFRQYWQNYELDERDHIGPFFSWLSNMLPTEEYGDMHPVACEMRLRNGMQCPLLVVQSEDHPLYAEQRHGMSYEKALRIVRPHIRWHS